MATLAKDVFSVLARTDFKTMFSMLPQGEQGVITKNMELWVSTMLSKNAVGQPYAREEAILSQVLDDPQSKEAAIRIKTSRMDWLSQMPERDLLTYEGKQDVPSGPTEKAIAEDKLREEVRKGLSGIEFQSGKRTKENQNLKDYEPNQEQPDPVKMPTEGLTKLVDSLKDIYQGMGELGNRMDLVKYTGPKEPTEATKATIVEIRKPPEVASKNWAETMDTVYNAVDDAIRYPRGKIIQERDYQGVLTERQQELREEANQLREKVERDREWTNSAISMILGGQINDMDREWTNSAISMILGGQIRGHH